MKKGLWLLLVGMLSCIQTSYAQKVRLSEEKERKLEIVSKRMFRDFQETHNLKSLKQEKKLNLIQGQVICVPPSKYGLSFDIPQLEGGNRKQVVSSSLWEMPTSETEETPVAAQPDEYNFLVKDVSSSKLKVIYQGQEYKIRTDDSAFENLMLKSDLDDIQGQIEQLYAAAEKEAQEQLVKNLAYYRESIAKFKQGSTGPIAISKKKREYDGSIPFAMYASSRFFSESFLDETFVFKQDAVDKVIADLKNSTDRYKQKEKDIEVSELEAMRNDTLGLFLNSEKKSYDNTIEKMLLINLRTGVVLSDFHFNNIMMSRNLLESTTYLNNIKNVKPYEYDGSYGLQELLRSYRWTLKYPQTVCDALIGEKVYVMKTDNYDEDEISEFKYKDDDLLIITKKNGQVKPDRLIGAKWLDKLQKYIGEKEVLVPTGNDILYKEDVAGMTTWTVKGIEAKQYHNAGGIIEMELDMVLIDGNETARIDVVKDCQLMTHPFDLKKPVRSNGRTAVPYNYLMTNAPKMPEDVKKRRENFSRALKGAIDEAVREYDPQKDMQRKKTQEHIYECKYCHTKLKATGKNDFWESGSCPTSGGIGHPHSWGRID